MNADDRGCELVAASEYGDCNLVAGNLIEAPAAPGTVTVLPWGEFECKGRRFRYTEESIPLIAGHIAARSTDLVIDYDHGCSVNPPADGIARAAGWIERSSLQLQAGQPLAASVKWTPPGARAVHNREFRYLSPTFLARPDGLVMGLHSVALTNTPAIDMAPIAAHTRAADAAAERTQAMKDIATCLGLAAEATKDQILAKCQETLVSASEAKGLRDAVMVFAHEVGDESLAAQFKDGKVEVVAASLKTAGLKLKNPAGMVAASEYEALKTRLAGVESTLADRDCEALIAAHANRLPPAKREWFTKFYKADRAAAEAWIREAPELVAAKADATGGEPKPGAVSRAAKITELRTKFRSENLGWGGRTEREFVNGELIAASMGPLTKEDTEKYELVG